MKKLTAILLLTLLPHLVMAQSTAYLKATEAFEVANKNFINFISNDRAIKFAEICETIITSYDTFLAGGHGLSFDEMNSVRVYRKYITSMYGLCDLVGNRGVNTSCSIKKIQNLKELYPFIELSNYKSYKGELYVYKLTINKYHVYIAQHLSPKITKRIKYFAGNSLHNVEGDFGLGYKCLGLITDNIRFKYEETINVMVTNVEDLNYSIISCN